MTTKITLTRSVFKAPTARIVISRDWVSNNHWIIHKSLIENVLDFVSLETFESWYRPHTIEPMYLTSADVTRAIKKCGGIMLEPLHFLSSIYAEAPRKTQYHMCRNTSMQSIAVRRQYVTTFRALMTHAAAYNMGTEEFVLRNKDKSFMCRPSTDRLKAKLRKVEK